MMSDRPWRGHISDISECRCGHCERSWVLNGWICPSWWVEDPWDTEDPWLQGLRSAPTVATGLRQRYDPRDDPWNDRDPWEQPGQDPWSAPSTQTWRRPNETHEVNWRETREERRNENWTPWLVPDLPDWGVPRDPWLKYVEIWVLCQWCFFLNPGGPNKKQ